MATEEGHLPHRVLLVDYLVLGVEPGDRVLDVGCGTGRHVNGAACHEPCLAVGVDILRPDLLEAKAMIARSKTEPWIKGDGVFAEADGRVLPFADDSFDRVIGCEVLEHVDEDDLFMQEMERVLRPGGTMVVSVPRFLPEAICWGLNRPLMTYPGSHVRIYPPAWVESKLRGLGLEPYAHEHLHAYQGLFWIVKSGLDRIMGGPRSDRVLAPIKRRLDRYAMRPKPLGAKVEDVLNKRLSKSCVIYARKPLDSGSVEEAA